MKKMSHPKGTKTRTVAQGGSPMNHGLKTMGPGLSKAMMSKKGVAKGTDMHNRKSMAKHKTYC